MAIQDKDGALGSVVDIPQNILTGDVLLVTNRTSADNGLLINHSSETQFELLGVEGAVTAIDVSQTKLCLAPDTVEIPASEFNKTACFNAEGYFAVEINGVVTPHYYSQDELIKAFNGNNDYPIKISKCNNYICTPASIGFNPYEVSDLRELNELEWTCKYSVDGGEIYTYTASYTQNNKHPTDAFRQLINSIFDNFQDIILVDGGGGSGNFQIYNDSLTGASGVAENAEQSHTVRLYRDTSTENDLVHFFFDLTDEMVDGEYVEAISCGTKYFPGY